MRKVRRPLPTSLRKAIIKRNKDFSNGVIFITCSKAVKVYRRDKGFLGNAYFNGNNFYFSAQLMRSLFGLPYPQSSQTMGYISWFLGGILEDSGFKSKV